MRKPTFCICENKDADKLRGNREADQRLCFRYIDSTIPLLPVNEILASSHLVWLCSPVCVGPGRKPRRPVFSQRGSYYVPMPPWECQIQSSVLPGAVAWSVGRLFAITCCRSIPRVRHILLGRFGHENISTAILPLIQEEQLSINGKRTFARYWFTASGRLAQEQCG